MSCLRALKGDLMGKGIGLEMVGGMILAIIGVLILIGLFANNFSFKNLYCSISSKVLLLLPHKGDLPPAPKGCRAPNEGCVDENLDVTSKEDASLYFAGSIVNCWNRYEGFGDVEKLCKCVYVSNLEDEIYENDINSVLIEQNLCPSQIENSEIEFGGGDTCGSKNQIVFGTSSIKKGDYIIVSYKNGAIHVR